MRKRRYRFSLNPWPQGDSARRAYVDPIFATIASRYDLMTRLMSFGQEQTWKTKAVSQIPQEKRPQRILDLATGSGDFPLHLHRAGFAAQLVGVDRNPRMLAIAGRKCAPLPRTSFVLGDLMEIPMKANSFDVVTMGYGLRYVSDIRLTLSEIFRLLRSGGLFVCLDFGHPKSRVFRRGFFAYLIFFGSLWGLILHRDIGTYWHIVESLRAYPGQERVRTWLTEAGFSEVRVSNQLGGIVAIISAVRP